MLSVRKVHVIVNDFYVIKTYTRSYKSPFVVEMSVDSVEIQRVHVRRNLRSTVTALEAKQIRTRVSLLYNSSVYIHCTLSNM